MANITKETYEANGIEVIADEFGKLWLNERHVQKQLGLTCTIYLQQFTCMYKQI